MIDEETFTRKHWEAFVKLNTAHNGEYFEVLHNGLKFKQYVGVLQVDGLLVHIHPKADKDDSDTPWKGVLLQMLKACGRIKALSAGNAHLRKQHINILEIYFEYYLSELETLIHGGLVKKYRNETSNVKALKGKLDFAGNIRKNLVHQERFYTTHQVYDLNHKLHHVLAHALLDPNTLEKNAELTGDYNVPRAVVTFNKRIEPLLVVFKQEVRDSLIVADPAERGIFTTVQCELINGQPFEQGDQDTLEEVLTLSEGELSYWDKRGLDCNYMYELAEPDWKEKLGTTL